MYTCAKCNAPMFSDSCKIMHKAVCMPCFADFNEQLKVYENKVAQEFFGVGCEKETIGYLFNENFEKEDDDKVPRY